MPPDAPPDAAPDAALRAAFAASGLGVSELARRAGVSASHVSRWRAGKRGLAAPTAAKLARAMGAPEPAGWPRRGRPDAARAAALALRLAAAARGRLLSAAERARLRGLAEGEAASAGPPGRRAAAAVLAALDAGG